MTILVTGAAGFIGSNFVLDWLEQCNEPVVNLDLLTYAGNLENLASLQGNPNHVFIQGDLGDRDLVDRLLAVLFVEVGKYLPTGLITSLMNLKLNLNSKQIPITLSTADYLDPAPAAGLLLLYGVVFAAVAVFTTLRRDID